MAKTYSTTATVRAVNRLVMMLTRLGLAGPHGHTLTTIGRRTGSPRSTPVTVLTLDGVRYLVSPYGQTGWVHNISGSAGRAVLSRRGHSEAVLLTEVVGDEAGRALQAYWTRNRIVRPYFDTTEGSDLAGFVSEAPRHPALRIDTQERPSVAVRP